MLVNNSTIHWTLPLTVSLVFKYGATLTKIYGATQRSGIFDIQTLKKSLALLSLNRSEQVHADRPQGLIYLFSRHFYPNRLTNKDNRSNQNQQKSNNM